MTVEDQDSGESHETAIHASKDGLRRHRSGRLCRCRFLRIGSDRNDVPYESRQLDDRGKEPDLGDSTNDPRGLPTGKGTEGKVPAKRNAGTVRQRGTIHVRSHEAVSMMRFADGVAPKGIQYPSAEGSGG